MVMHDAVPVARGWLLAGAVLALVAGTSPPQSVTTWGLTDGHTWYNDFPGARSGLWSIRR